MTLSELIDSVPLEEYIGQYTELKWKNGELWGISPISRHDTNPSLSINKNKNVFCDFSSGARGNIINFIMAYHGCDLYKAIQHLKEYANVTEEITDSGTPQILKVLRRYRQKKEPQKCSHTVLHEDELDKYAVYDFPYWEDEGIDGSIAMMWGCGYDNAKDAITIPVRDMDGNLINILYRNMNPLREEIGIPKYIYKYKLGTLDFLWGWSESKPFIEKENCVLIFEGAKSVIKSSLFEHPNAAALLTSHLGDEQMKLLAASGVDCVFMLDKDQQHPERDDNICKLKRFCRVYICKDEDGLLGEKDSPVDRGQEVFEKILAGRRRLK